MNKRSKLYRHSNTFLHFICVIKPSSIGL